MMKLLQAIGMAPTTKDKKLIELVSNSYQSVRVVGRGTVIIDPQEVRSTPQFKEDARLAKAIVES